MPRHPKVQALIESLQGKGHPEYPLLDAVYSPNTGMPCDDFTPWLAEQFALNDRDAIASFMSELHGDSSSAFRLAQAFFDNDWSSKITAPSQVFHEFQAIALLAKRHLSGFDDISANRFSQIIKNAFLFQEFDIAKPLLDRWLKTVNQIIGRNNKGLKDLGVALCPKLSAETLTFKSERPTSNIILNWLTLCPAAMRLHFFDTLQYFSNSVSSRLAPLRQTTFYGTREFGIDANKTGQWLSESGIFTPVTDFEKLIRYFSASDIDSLCLKFNIEIKKSWKKTQKWEYLINSEEGRSSILLEASKQGIANIDASYSQAIEELQHHLDKWEGIGLLLYFA